MSIDRAELQDAAAKAFGEAGLAAAPDTIWSLITDMGWLSMAVPEELGGLGLGREALGVVYSELGRVVAPGPIMAHMLVIEALCAADACEARQPLLEKAMAGEVMTTSLQVDEVDTRNGRINFTLTAVPDADKAGHLLLVTRDAASILLLPLDQEEGVSFSHRATWDETRRLFDVTLDGVDLSRAIVLAEGNDSHKLLKSLKNHLLFALAADSVGGAGAILDLTVDYLKTRRQYDRPLAMFQALKHRCADLKTITAATEALLWSTADGNGNPDLDPLSRAGALKARATSTYQMVAEEAVQLHGGIGLTEEHHCHLFLKRALLNLSLGGATDQWEERVGRAMLGALLARA